MLINFYSFLVSILSFIPLHGELMKTIKQLYNDLRADNSLSYMEAVETIALQANRSTGAVRGWLVGSQGREIPENTLKLLNILLKDVKTEKPE